MGDQEYRPTPSHGEGVAGISGAPRITSKMLDAAEQVYAEWEPHHIFGEFNPASRYAVRELAGRMFLRMSSLSNSRSASET